MRDKMILTQSHRVHREINPDYARVRIASKSVCVHKPSPQNSFSRFKPHTAFRWQNTLSVTLCEHSSLTAILS